MALACHIIIFLNKSCVMMVGLNFFFNLILYLNAKVDTFYIFDCAVVMSFLDENQNLDFIINY